MVIVGATVLAIPSLVAPLNTLDESLLLVYAEQVRSGLMPHRDFFTAYGPAPFYALASLFSVFGSSLEGERLLGLMFHVGIALGCYGMGQRLSRTAGASAAILSLVILLPLGAVAYAWMGAMACIVGALALVQFRRTGAVFLAGLVGGLGTAFRPELLPVVLAVLAPFAWRTSRWRWIASGLVCGLAPLFAFNVAVGDRMWRNIVIGRIGVNGSLRLSDDPVVSVVLLTSVGVVTGALVWLAWKYRGRARIAHALLAVGILPQALQRIDADHAIYTLCVTAPLLAMGAHPTSPSPAQTRSRTLTAAMALAVAGYFAAWFIRGVPQTVRVDFEGRSALVYVSEMRDLLETRAELLRHSSRGDTLFVGSTDMSSVSLSRISMYYLVPELRPRAYYLELAVGVAERAGSGLVADIRNADVLLLTSMPDGLMDRLYPYLNKGSEEANDLVSHEFCLVGETGWGRIYEHHACP